MPGANARHSNLGGAGNIGAPAYHVMGLGGDTRCVCRFSGCGRDCVPYVSQPGYCIGPAAGKSAGKDAACGVKKTFGDGGIDRFLYAVFTIYQSGRRDFWAVWDKSFCADVSETPSTGGGLPEEEKIRLLWLFMPSQ